MVGLIDLDLIYTKNLSQPNYELCAVSTYYKLQGINTRLVVDLKIENLLRYEKIYIFKSHKNNLLPSQFIKDYYRINAEEYGEGFANRPLHPDIPELVYTIPTPEIYFPIINFLVKNTQPTKYKLTHKTWFTKYHLMKCFYQIDEEILTRQNIPSIKKILIYDDPIIFFTEPRGRALLEELIKQNKQIQFTTPLDVSKLPKEYYDSIMTESKFASLRKTLYASSNNSNLKQFLSWCEINKERIKQSRLTIQLQTSNDYRYYLLNGLRIMTELPERLGKKLRVFPRVSHNMRKQHYLLKYFYSWQRGRIGSFYEYVIWRAYHKEIDKHKLNGKIDAYTIDFLFKHYGMRYPLVTLEEIMYEFKEAENLIMRGGKSYYGNERIKYSFIGGTPKSFKTKDFRTRNKRVTTWGPGGLHKRIGNVNPTETNRSKWLPSEQRKRQQEYGQLRNYKRNR